jgi:NAD(P)-dependent dehydrogenase (short-subunit alcohol dehydrogenase family)
MLSMAVLRLTVQAHDASDSDRPSRSSGCTGALRTGDPLSTGKVITAVPARPSISPRGAHTMDVMTTSTRTPQTWFITGASRGFGLLVAQEALRRGDRVIATARKTDGLAEQLDAGSDRALIVAVDVTDPSSIAAAVAAGLTQFGRIDVLLNNAGHGLLGAVEEVTDTAARAVFDVNVFGLLNVTRAILPTMRAQRWGTVLNVSSVAGQSSSPGWGVYAATKHAVEAINTALHAETAPLGIRVTAIEPGPFRTDFLDSSSLLTEGSAISDYDRTAGNARRWAADSNHAQLGDPGKAAAIMVDLAHHDDPPMRLPMGSDCVERIETVLAQQHDEINVWRNVSLSTDYTD